MSTHNMISEEIYKIKILNSCLSQRTTKPAIRRATSVDLDQPVYMRSQISSR